MSSEMTQDEDDYLAAEYALGLLTGDALADAQRRAGTDKDFAQSVTEWEIRLATLTEELAPETPGPAVRKNLIARVFPNAKPKSLWSHLWIWQAATVAGLVLFAVTLVTDLDRSATAPGPLYTAEIVTESGDFRVVAVVDKSTNEVFLTRTAGNAPEGRILQVWGHGEGAPAISVGLWPEGDSIRLPMPPTIAAVEGILTLGVSEEPFGGSPTGSPSGRVFGTVDIPGVVSGS